MTKERPLLSYMAKWRAPLTPAVLWLAFVVGRTLAPPQIIHIELKWKNECRVYKLLKQLSKRLPSNTVPCWPRSSKDWTSCELARGTKRYPPDIHEGLVGPFFGSNGGIHTHTMKLEFPRFDGKNPNGWLFKAMQ
ncbi:hypothetical protein MRB53_027648 [Persea americana]|uniref:Uncharacterized protein n=1 Tax=Persea americana TaxID=3435 RepID=A0ACC2LLP4_PERAE|nr:hypothetical protein MRB53_027648 [Persea americana]